MLVAIGMLVSGRESADVVGVIKEHLNIDETKAISLLLIKHNKKCEQINPSFLKRDFEEVPEDADLEPYVKAYLLHLLGTVIFPNSFNSVYVMYLPLLEKDKRDKYAWGVALLAYLKEVMVKACTSLNNEKSPSVDGFTHALQVRFLDNVTNLLCNF
ncbi:hypothetical protein M5689_006625 [Euphorbia peplus]|nr:hypothetical protein M5689_006625 [Euphorbia peplus]